jgi:SAM-dependent methyltransferase
MTDTSIDEREIDRRLKARHRAMWALGDYPDIAEKLTFALGRILVKAAGIEPGDRVLDVGAGSGAVAVPAAEAGGRVIACDLTPELFRAGRKYAEARGVEVEWQDADAEILPYADNTFDVVVSSLGVMFAPHHQAAADELLRVCRTGGTLGLLSWTPEGFLGQLLATIAPYVPSPPPGAQPPPLWGSQSHLADLLGSRSTPILSEKRVLRVDHYADAESFRDHFRRAYGPIITAYRHVAADAERLDALDHDLVHFARDYDLGGGVMEWEYLLTVSRVSN